MRFPVLFSQFTAPLGAGLLLGWICWRSLPTSKQQEHGLLLTAGLAKAEIKEKSRAIASERPMVKLSARPQSTAKSLHTSVPQITVSKSGAPPIINRKASKARWDYLDRSVRAKIDAANATPHRWKIVVIHSSATTCGSARAFDYYHRQVKHMEHGLAYHFVIGNGHGSGNGRIEVGPRWTLQEAGGHVRSEAQNEIALGICLVGDFQKGQPTQAQLEALDELIDYLEAKLGKLRVTTHRLINIRPTLCPGRNFPAAQFIEP